MKRLILLLFCSFFQKALQKGFCCCNKDNSDEIRVEEINSNNFFHEKEKEDLCIAEKAIWAGVWA